MTLRELLVLADKEYEDDGSVLAYHDEPDGNHGDTLAAFIASEITATFEENADDDDQISEVRRAPRPHF